MKTQIVIYLVKETEVLPPAETAGHGSVLFHAEVGEYARVFLSVEQLTTLRDQITLALRGTPFEVKP